MNSKYLCARCGLSVREWGSGWKHSGGSFAHSCGKVPKLMLREEYEKQIADLLGTAREFAQRTTAPRLEKFNNRSSSFSRKVKQNG